MEELDNITKLRVLFLMAGCVSPVASYAWKYYNPGLQSNVKMGWIMTGLFLIINLLSYKFYSVKKNFIYFAYGLFTLSGMSALYYSYLNGFQESYSILMITVIFITALFFRKPLHLLVYEIFMLIFLLVALMNNSNINAKSEIIILGYLIFAGISYYITLNKNIAFNDLIEAKIIAEKESTEKSLFLARLSHEIKNKLNGIRGIVSLLEKQDNFSEDDKEYLGLVKMSSDDMLNLLNDILDYSKIQAGKINIITEKFDFRDFIERNSEIYKINASTKNIEFFSEIDENVPRCICSDALRLGQILSNIIGNAIKFTGKGKVSLHIMNLSVDENSLILKFSVTDSGIGIAQDKIKLIFWDFEQSDNSITKRFGGTGLGLSISKNLVKLMGGDIECESEEGVGSKFSFTISSQKVEDEGVIK